MWHALGEMVPRGGAFFRCDYVWALRLVRREARRRTHCTCSSHGRTEGKRELQLPLTRRCRLEASLPTPRKLVLHGIRGRGRNTRERERLDARTPRQRVLPDGAPVVQIPRLASLARDDHGRETPESSRAQSRDLYLPPVPPGSFRSSGFRVVRNSAPFGISRRKHFAPFGSSPVFPETAHRAGYPNPERSSLRASASDQQFAHLLAPRRSAQRENKHDALQASACSASSSSHRRCLV